MAPPTKKYQTIKQAAVNAENLRDTYQGLFNTVSSYIKQGTPLPESFREQFASQGGLDVLAAFMDIPAGEAKQAGAHTILSALQKAIEFQNDEVERYAGQLYSIDANYAVADFPEYATEFLPDVYEAFPQQDQQQAAVQQQFTVGRDGSVFAFDPVTAQVRKLGTFPELGDVPNLQFSIGRDGSIIAIDPSGRKAPTVVGQFDALREMPTYQFQRDATTGNLVAINPQDPSDRTNLGQFSFPDVDPMLDFNLRALQVQQGFMGLELEQRGQQIQALTQDMAFQIEVGQMTYQEAALQLNRISEALNQRRQEREVLLQYAVTRSSLVERGGETLTRLPFAEQTASILSQATGRTFTSRDFEIPVGEIDPDAAARAVVQASAFTSPIPGLRQNLAQTRSAIESIVNAPLGNSAVTEQATQNIVEGIS